MKKEVEKKFEYYRGDKAFYEIYVSAAGEWCVAVDSGNYNDRKHFVGFETYEDVYSFIVEELEDGNIPEGLE